MREAKVTRKETISETVIVMTRNPKSLKLSTNNRVMKIHVEAQSARLE